MTFFENIVLDKLSQFNGSLFDFLYSFNGIYIGEIYSILLDIESKKIKTSEHISFKVSNFIKDFHQSFNIYEYKMNLRDINYFPVPHMLDADWRFTRNSALQLLDKIKCYSGKPTDNFVMIGAPSIFSLLDKRIDFKSAKLLIDQNYIYNGIIRKNNIICNDIASFELYNFADIILCDPPWYLQAIKNFMEKSFSMLRHNGFLVIALPPSEVRETIENEYRQIDSFSENLGLGLIEEYDNIIEYVSPPFEVNSLISIGVTNFPINWRRGKLRIYRKIIDETKKTNNDNKIYPDIWHDITIRNVRFKTKISSEESNRSTECVISSIEDIKNNDIFPTVSMRTGKQNEVDIWTSGNRVYKCSNTQKFISICNDILKFGDSKTSSKPDDEILRISSKINDILSIENDEYADVWGEV